ncbi:uncharacterized protein LOC105390163 isoform X2 [Plutella xylostella]|uniref:uncharacterized protein LOC105390163 isoform X2 n=1 Tax=Plutella xylostella TaxID=51655 RepID=UPI00203301D8|nr:uncharacterized protein LOC105390163 isoform X2 [Plutella xylostella]
MAVVNRIKNMLNLFVLLSVIHLSVVKSECDSVVTCLKELSAINGLETVSSYEEIAGNRTKKFTTYIKEVGDNSNDTYTENAEDLDKKIVEFSELLKEQLTQSLIKYESEIFKKYDDNITTLIKTFEVLDDSETVTEPPEQLKTNVSVLKTKDSLEIIADNVTSIAASSNISKEVIMHELPTIISSTTIKNSDTSVSQTDNKSSKMNKDDQNLLAELFDLITMGASNTKTKMIKTIDTSLNNLQKNVNTTANFEKKAHEKQISTETKNITNIINITNNYDNMKKAATKGNSKILVTNNNITVLPIGKVNNAIKDLKKETKLLTQTNVSNYILTTEATLDEEKNENDGNETINILSIDDKNLNNIYQENYLKYKLIEEQTPEDKDFVYDLIAFDDNNTDYPKIDYVEMYKDTTNEDIGFTTPNLNLIANENKEIIEDITESVVNVVIIPCLENLKNCSVNENTSVGADNSTGTLTTDSCVTRSRSRDVTSVLFPWVAAIFVRDVSSSRYTYVCDGAVLSQYTVLTAAHCLRNGSVVIPLKDIIIVLGKLSQKDMDGNEIYKPRDVIIHNSYSQDGGVRHDLALLVTETRIEYREKRVEPACLPHGETEAIEAVSTGWNISGDLIPIPFRGGHNDDCLQEHEKQSKNVFCSTYLSDITTCPSYGGIYAERLRDGVWYLRGIQTADEINQRFCVNRNVRYTDLTKYADWLRLNVV